MMVASGLNVILVPVFFPALPVCFSGPWGMPFSIVLLPGKCFVPDLQMQRFRQRIHAADADAMQPARYFVALRIELAAGVQLGHHHFGRRNSLLPCMSVGMPRPLSTTVSELSS